MAATITLEQAKLRFKAIARKELQALVLNELTGSAIDMELRADQNLTERRRRRTGNLARSIEGGTRTKGTISTMFLAGGGGTHQVKYARLQEEGGTVRPKKGQWLAYPMRGGPAETAAGVPRYKSPRQVQGLRFARVGSSGGGKAVLLKDKQIWFVLVRSATIQPSWFLRDAFQNEAKGVKSRLATRVAALIANGPAGGA